jgi:hypothetical protein
MARIGLHQIGQSGATDGQGPVWDDALGVWVPADGTGVVSVVAGDGVMVDATDPAHPIVTAVRRELLMQDGVTSPPVPIETEAGDDWLYQD